MKPETAPAVLAGAVERFADPALEWRAEALKAAMEEVGAAQGLNLGKAQAPVRVAVAGRTVGLPLFESLELLGRERTQSRGRAALTRVG